mmetsp:Transcript_100499/g.279939  ORF Transcript_100499/g.279939 Transcript_100499/m.279939 type:complete len:291 (-) Transcript_100499:379-1251(-)
MWEEHCHNDENLTIPSSLGAVTPLLPLPSGGRLLATSAQDTRDVLSEVRVPLPGVGFEEGDGGTWLPVPARAADAVHIGLHVEGKVKVHHVTDAIDVQTTAEDVRPDENTNPAVAEGLERVLALLLLHAPVHHPAPIQLELLHEEIPELCTRITLAHEDQHLAGDGAPLAESFVEVRQQQWHLPCHAAVVVRRWKHLNDLADRRRRQGDARAPRQLARRHARRDVRKPRVGPTAEAPGLVLHLRAPRRGEEEHLRLALDLVEDARHRALEVLFEHLIGLVEDDEGQHPEG